MLRSSSRDGLQSAGYRGFALAGALRRRVCHVLAAGTQEHGRKYKESGIDPGRVCVLKKSLSPAAGK